MITLPWRSLLYVPAHKQRFIERAHTRGADAIQLDLEDSVPAEKKQAARGNVQASAPIAGQRGANVIVRINRPWRLALRDIEAAVDRHVDAIAMPKVASAEHVRLIDEVVTELEAERGLDPGHTRLIAMIETAGGFMRSEAIARSSPRLVALTLGTEDFAFSMGIEPEADLMSYPKQHVIISARAAGIEPIGLVGSIANYGDLDAFRAIALQSRRLGSRGASAIHPAQIPILNEVFSPSQEEVEHALAIIQSAEDAAARGDGATTHNGFMIDAPIVHRAQQLVDLDARIKSKSAR